MRDYSDAPAIVVWEMTRACRLACVHCRASAQPQRDPGELTTAEGKKLLDDIAAGEPMLLILTGGDPARREDALELISHAAGRGMRVAFSPSATPDFLKMDFRELKNAGVCRVSLSIDGATEDEHNAFRGVKRAWEWTMEAIRRLKEAGLGFQINSTITAGNIARFSDMVRLVEGLQPAGWTVFLAVPTGRGERVGLPDAEDVERLLEELVALSRRVDFEIRTTEGMHFRRVIAQGKAGEFRGRPPAPINDGRGFVFVSHKGDICPSGFLPLAVGNVRQDDFLSTYRDSPLFKKLRDPKNLGGKCGRCEFNRLCGGSRARAFGLTGDPFAEDPLCSYQPKP